MKEPTVLRAVRKLFRLSQDQLSSRSGICQSRISYLEAGHINPSKRERGALARALEVPPEILFPGGSRPLEKRWISPREAAEYLGCHIQTLYVWIARGEVPSARLGRKVLIDLKRLDAQLEGSMNACGTGGRGSGALDPLRSVPGQPLRGSNERDG